MNTTAIATRTKPSPAGTTTDVCDAIASLAKSCTSAEDLYTQVLQLIASHYDSPYAALHISNRCGAIERRVSSGDKAEKAWKQMCEGLLLGATYNKVASARRYDSATDSGRFAVLTAPIRDNSKRQGAIAVVVQCLDRDLAEARLHELRALLLAVSGLSARATHGSPTVPIAADSQRVNDFSGPAKASGYENLYEFAFAITNNLKAKLNCEQISLGMVRRGRVRVLCISGFDKLYPRNPGVQLIQQAMAECLDADHPLVFQKHDQWAGQVASSGHRLHKAWHDRTGGAAVASVPLKVGESCVAVLSLRNQATRPFRSEELEKASKLVTPLAPGLLLLEKASRSISSHMVEEMGRCLVRLLPQHRFVRVGLSASLLWACTWLLFGKQAYVVTVPCEIVPAHTVHIAAPFQGVIRSAHVKPGDRVRTQDLLLSMQTHALNLERERLLAALEMAKLEMTQAAAEKDVISSSQGRARLRVVEADLRIVDHKIRAAEVRAPSDGFILSGEVMPRVGEVVPLGEPLLKFAQCNAWSVSLHVHEHAAPYVAAGQSGEFTTHARPEEKNTCLLNRVMSTAEVIDGNNVIRAEATVQGETPQWLRSGMKGVARIDTGRYAVWWVWLHRAIDAVRLQLWKL